MHSHLIAEFEKSVFFNKTPDLVFIADRAGYFKKINQSVIDKLGYTEIELFSRPIASFIHPEDRLITQQLRNDLLNGKVLRNFCNRYITKSGSFIWLDWTSVYFEEEQVVFAVAKDVTERKFLEEEHSNQKYLELKNMATHFKKRIEKDKQYFAYELHEELAQLVAAIKIDLDWVGANLPVTTSSIVKSRIDNAALISKMLIKSIQRISFSISPGMLDELGLNTTIDWLCNEFSILNNIPCNYTCRFKEGGLSPEIKTDVFRICQESLTNITYHAGASSVAVLLEDVDNLLQLTITDNGKGFESGQTSDTSGLANMYKRAASVNGQLNISSELGQGTTIIFTVQRNKN
ncbi:MAG: PAS domain S-box protein [Bacteroidetes bacterium]|nr:PAS domain S-box protein [Bacteroidota bacterium]